MREQSSQPTQSEYETNIFCAPETCPPHCAANFLFSLLCFFDFITLSSVMAQSRASGAQATDALNLQTLYSDLSTVAKWYELGINLGLPKHELDKIQLDHAHHGNDRQRVEMLDLWLRGTTKAAYGDVEIALRKMGENRVAESIHQNYIRESKRKYSSYCICNCVCNCLLVIMYCVLRTVLLLDQTHRP